MLLLYVVFIVYIVAVNFYAVLLLKTQRDESCGDDGKTNCGDGKLILTAILGAAVGIYVAMLILRYRTKNLLLMVLMPLIVVFNVYLAIAAFRSGVSYFVV